MLAVKIGKPFLIAIAGGSASGKSTLARLIQDSLPAGYCSILPLDSSYRSEAAESSNAPLHPDSVDVDLLLKHLASYIAGEEIGVEQRISPAPVLILEGLFTLHWPSLRKLVNLKVFVDAPEPLRFERRLHRDTAEGRRSGDSVRRHWRENILPMHRRFCEPAKQYADFVIPGSEITPGNIQVLLSRILF